MNKRFEIIQGNTNSPVATKDDLQFISAFATNTRLMGVVVLSISWEYKTLETGYHQFFYFDAEEYGLESVSTLSGDDPLQLLTLENTLIGGLGGKKVSLSEDEAIFLLRHFVSVNQSLGKSLPTPTEEYAFLLTPLAVDSYTGLFPIMKKICAPIQNKYELINYFLMRSFARDLPAIAFLSGGRPLLPYQGKPATLHKNTIHESDENGSVSYVCESLIEINQNFTVIITELFLKENLLHDLKVSDANITSSLKITQSEAAMMLMRSEFITVYQVLDIDEFLSPFLSYALNFAKTAYDFGTLFIQFNPDNNHVRNMQFRLNHDVTGLYYLSEFGQLIVASYEEPTIKELERRLSRRSMNSYLLLEDRFEFKSPVLYEFILSDFDDFLEFVAATE